MHFFLYHGLYSTLLRDDGEKAPEQSGLSHRQADNYTEGMPVALGPDRHQEAAAKKLLPIWCTRTRKQKSGWKQFAGQTDPSQMKDV